MADLYRWRYNRLGDLGSVATERRFQLAVPGFAHPFQLIDVVDPNGAPNPNPNP
jgi:intron-binding protein aquarius